VGLEGEIGTTLGFVGDFHSIPRMPTLKLSKCFILRILPGQFVIHSCDRPTEMGV